MPLLASESCASCTAILDERLPLPPLLASKLSAIHRVRPRLYSRLKAEQTLRSIAKQEDVVLCMGNLPPMFSLRAKVFVFLHNRYLVESGELFADFPTRGRLRILLERLWLRCRCSNADTFIVQTDSMKEIVASALGVQPCVLPFTADGGRVRRLAARFDSTRKYDFLYVASGEPHKNHVRLMAAWVLLARAGMRPHLCLTVAKTGHPRLEAWIELQKAEFGLNISNIGELSSAAALQLYQDSGALIFPSTLESFGLPLIEARQAGLPILASELDYVRDLVDPEETFDPYSPRSIARAVMRFLGMPHTDSSLLDADEFLRTIIEKKSC